MLPDMINILLRVRDSLHRGQLPDQRGEEVLHRLLGGEEQPGAPRSGGNKGEGRDCSKRVEVREVVTGRGAAAARAKGSEEVRISHGQGLRSRGLGSH